MAYTSRGWGCGGKVGGYQGGKDAYDLNLLFYGGAYDLGFFRFVKVDG